MYALDSTKYQMSVLTANGNEFRDISYTNMISSNVGGIHSMYILTEMNSGKIFLPEQIASKLGPDPKDKSNYFKNVLNGEFPDEENFLLIVAKNYLYSSRIDITEDEAFISEMKKDGNYEYWKAVFHEIVGYQDDEGKYIGGRGFIPISQGNAVDRGWLEKNINEGKAQLFKLTKETSLFQQDKINIFAETNLGTDTELREVQNTELIDKATVDYEKAIDDINVKETKLDMQLSRIDTQHQALKTEYDSVKQIVSKNIDRSFKTFNV